MFKNHSILPALAFILDMNRRTGGFYGVNEALFSSALACMVFSTLGAQPLTIVGITGLISLFNYTIFDIIKRHDVGLYPQFMSWVAIWAAIFHWMFAVFNFCDYMRYVTDFSSQSFGAYVGIIYCSRSLCLMFLAQVLVRALFPNCIYLNPAQSKALNSSLTNSNGRARPTVS